ncbi:MAG: hypothetical protein ACPGTU_00125 [Myxococcota bacterium]
MTRLHTNLGVGLDNGWQVRLAIPFDIKFMTIEYRDKQGNAYVPDYGNIHHRNETISGFGDGKLELKYLKQTSTQWTLGGGVGSMLPLGKTEENPYQLAKESKEHQHVQMGAGTWDPVLSFTAVWMDDTWGMQINADGRLPLYENSRGFKPSPSLQIEVGPSYRLSTKWMLTAGVLGTHEWIAYWDGEPDPKTGRTAILLSGSGIYRFNPSLAAMMQVSSTVAQWSTETLIQQFLIGSAGLTWTPNKNKPH